MMRVWASAILLGLAAAGPVAGQITVVKPLDPIPPRRLLYHPPELLYCPQPEYPDSLKRRGIGGHVLLEVVVDTLGRVAPDRIVVRESSDSGLSRAAITMADRKSTRLNSSHVRISYAVFCLKKKKYFCL